MLAIDSNALERMFLDGLVDTTPDVLTLFVDMHHYANRNDHEICLKMVEDNHGR